MSFAISLSFFSSFSFYFFSDFILTCHVHVMNHGHHFIKGLRIHLVQNQLGIIAILNKALRVFIFYEINNTSKFLLFKVSHFIVKFLFVMVRWGLVILFFKKVCLRGFFLLWLLGLTGSFYLEKQILPGMVMGTLGK